MLGHEPASTASPSAVACRKAPGGSATVALPMRTVGAARCAISSPWRVSRGETMDLGKAHQRGGSLRRQAARAAHVNVEPGIGRRHLDVERLLHRAERFGERPGDADGAVERSGQHRATIDRDDVVCPVGRKADLEHVMHAAPRMEHRAPPTLPVRIDQVADRGVDARLPQRCADQGVLPFPIALEIPVLGLAAAAHAEMRADRRDASRARRLDAQQVTPVRMARKGLDLHHLARQRVGHESRPSGRLGDAVAAMTEARDGQAFGHFCSGMILADLPTPAEASIHTTGLCKGIAQAGNRLPLFGIMPRRSRSPEDTAAR